MSAEVAPLVTRCEQLTRSLLARMQGWSAPAVTVLGQPLLAAAITLQCAVTGGLLHRDDRAAELRRADRALTRLRVLLGISDEVPALFEAAHRLRLGEEMQAIGQMLGGWRKRVRSRDARASAD